MHTWQTFCRSFSVTICNLFKILVDIPYYVCALICCLLASFWRMLTRRRKNLDKDVILITGAASGLGQMVVYKLAKLSSKATFVLWDINQVGLSETAEKCRELNALNVFTYVVDLSNYDDVARVASMVKAQVGTVTILFNNAGYSPYKLFLNSDPKTEETTIRVNLLSQMWTIREFLPGMIENKKGHLVSTCSSLAFHRFSHLSSYVASKYGLRGFLETLKLEMAKHPEIKFSVIYPGWVHTPMTNGLTWETRYEIDGLIRMNPNDVVDRMVDGILKEEEEIVIPWFLKHAMLLTGFFPTKFVSIVSEKHMFQNVRLVETV